MFCVSAYQAAIRRKNRDWLVRIGDYVSEWRDMSTHELLFRWAKATEKKKKRVGLLGGNHLIEMQIFGSIHSCIIAHSTLNHNRSFTHSVKPPTFKTQKEMIIIEPDGSIRSRSNLGQTQDVTH